MTAGARVSAIVYSLAMAAMAFAGPYAQAFDLDKEVVFHIPRQPLETALLEFSRQADVQVAIASDSIRNQIVPGIDGKWPVGAALIQLLQGSGLTYSMIRSTVTVTRPTSRDERNDALISNARARENPPPHSE